MSRDEIGVRQQKLTLLTADQKGVLILIGLVPVAAVLWHLTIVLTAGVPAGSFGITFRALLHGTPLDGLPASYPPSSMATTLMVFGAMLLAVLLLGFLVMLHRAGRPTRKIIGLATGAQARQSAGERLARQRARYPRQLSIAQGLDVDRCPLSEVASLIGAKADDREPIVIPNSEQVGVMGPTGSGKSLLLAIGLAIDAPGPLVATSTKPEILDAIVEMRASRGHIWVFDPLDRAGWPEPMIWNPVRGGQDSEIATGRGLSFAGGLGADGDPKSSSVFFQRASGIVIARMVHAAALEGLTIEDVIRWAMDIDRSAGAATAILKSHPDAEIMWDKALEVATQGADETVSSTRMTLGQKVDPLLSRKVLRQMLPREGVVEFDASKFVQSKDTLVLITDDNAATNVAPLTTMLLDDVYTAAKRAAARSMSGFVDPPLRVVGDELANVAPLPMLPGLLSDSRGSGIQWFCFFQSLAQMISRWGNDGANQILANLNAMIVMGGLQDDAALERFSKLVGAQELPTVSTTLGDGNVASSRNVSMTERTLLRPEQIRQLPDGKALLVYRNAPAMVVDLTPWTARPDADEIKRGMDHIRRLRIGGAT